MRTRIAPRGAVIAASLSTILLAACAKQEQVSEVEWAKAALARNPALEILSTDETAGTFSVRDTTTGAVYKLHTQELMAAPLPSKLASSATPAAAAAPATETPAQPETPAEADEFAADQTTEAVAAVRGSGEQLAEGPGYSISRGHAQDSAPTKTIEGPGYSITREAPATAPPVTPSAETVTIEKRTDPIICQGDRLMHIDGETMEFTGDAVIAEKGCDLYISNARIRAGGVGIIARQARVHIVNSTIGGSRGSYEVSDGAELYAARSTFSGIGRRFDTAAMNDLGGNEYLIAH
ncbi:MAG TPA: hypothetical protein VFO82_16275 [Steroidobacteraceae bacterium]|nr:hypothetical protein [Steroidobacteraceae bacterium]